MIPPEKLCPFDKDPCIMVRCAIWDPDEEVCSLALIPSVIRGNRPSKKLQEKTGSSGLSGRFRDPLFD
ncbi:MAG: hypothetical protein LUQ50_12945 [Methanospirillum sp.]|uniref:hypothetical protein n=1 Tax=Methanospirillum sp. TaxID=45200 RepID=UPI00237006DC|nr:hypothetical protein [Methanospirillum sp.]MDD1729962.1 hypothetical protein [Methanospirillum sp.]